MTVKEETSDGLATTTEQTPTTRQQEEQTLSPNSTTDGAGRTKLPTKTGIFWALVSAHQARSFPFPKRQFGKSKLVFLSFQVRFITKGYSNGNDATRKKAGFSQHESPQCHREAVERSIALHATTKNAASSAYRCVVTGMGIIQTLLCQCIDLAAYDSMTTSRIMNMKDALGTTNEITTHQIFTEA